MFPTDNTRVGYVVKRYPRYSETFIVNEILAHEAAGLYIEIFSLYPPNDDHFQDAISQVRAPVTYLTPYGLKAADFWSALRDASDAMPGVWYDLQLARNEEDVRDVYQALLLARAARQRGIGHLHAHFATSATTVVRLAAQFAGIPYTFTAHAKDIFHESVQSEDLRNKLRDASAVVTVSEFNLQHLRETFGAAADRVRRIYNGIDLDHFPFTPSEERSPLVVGVGRLVEKKGFADLVDACALLARKGVDFRCIIVGTGELENEIRKRIEQQGLADRVQLVGPKPQCEVIKLVSSAAVLAAPCVVGADGNRDGLPTVLLEAMALGTPCVATDVTGIPEVLRHEETGLMVPQRDPQQLAASIERLLDDAALRLNLATAARRLVEEEFSVHRNAARLRQLFAPASHVELESVAVGGARL
jgi:glycosyltransferase involved in cell wall biosynthesis